MRPADGATGARGADAAQGAAADGRAGPLPLAGIRVLDLSRVLAGPWATQILGDLGADVIKIERPGTGDDTRHWGPPWLDGAEGVGAYYLACNRNKRSVAVDIARPEGAALIRRLAAGCDVVVENFKVGDLARYGLDQASLRAVNPRLICCSISGFGQDGPYAERGGYDFLIQAMGGLMSLTGPEDGEPTKVGVPVIDLFTGLYAAIAIQAALRHRDLTGEGQSIDCALLDTAVAILANQGMNWLVGGQIPRPLGNRHPTVVPYRPFRAADGELIVAVGNDGQFRALCRVLGRMDLAEDPANRSSAARQANRVALEAALEAEIARRHRDELLDAMRRAGVPGGPINRLDQVFADPQVIARAMVQPVARPDGPDLPLTRMPVRMSASPPAIRRPPPTRIGQDSLEVLAEMGLERSEIGDLVARNVVVPPADAGAGEEEKEIAR